MSFDEIFKAAVVAIIGGSGIVGLLFFFLRRYLETRLKHSEEEERKLRETRIRRMQIEDELQHAYGRMFFWMHRAITTKTHNGELETAFHALEEVEAKKKDLDREIIAEHEKGGKS